MVAFALRLDIYWMGKQPLFRWPFGPLMRWLGGIAVNREQSCNLAAASAQAIRDAVGPLILVLPPEGTCSKTRHRRTGFYWIAHQAQVPIVMAYMDYPRKLSGLGLQFRPTGNIDADMVEIKAWYSQFKGKNWQQFAVGWAGAVRPRQTLRGLPRRPGWPLVMPFGFTAPPLASPQAR